MKTRILTFAALLFAAHSFAQGAVDFGNYNLNVNVVIREIEDAPGGWQVSYSAPAGSFDVALYWASGGTVGMTTANSTLVALGLGQPAGGGVAGTFENGEITDIPNAASPGRFIVEASLINVGYNRFWPDPTVLKPGCAEYW